MYHLIKQASLLTFDPNKEINERGCWSSFPPANISYPQVPEAQAATGFPQGSWHCPPAQLPFYAHY